MTAFVLGNGVSRQNISVDLLLQRGSVYGCNALYRTHQITALVATDDKIARAIEATGYPQRARFYTRRPSPKSSSLLVPRPYHGFSSGPIASAIAAADQHPVIYLLGFDMAPAENGRFNNVYAGTEFYKPPAADPTYTGNWQRQLIQVMRDHSQQRFIRIHGATTAHIAEFDQLVNHEKMALSKFLELINNTKDLPNEHH
jgi:hypothetical protein